MKKVNIGRGRKTHGTRRAILAVGALGAAAEGIRRWRHRHQPDQPAG